MIKNISNLGDAALYCDFGQEVNKETNSLVIKYFKSLQKKDIRGITNLTPSYNKLIISFDLTIIDFDKLKKIIENLDINESKSEKSKKIEIPVCCDDTFSLDINRLESKLSLTKEKIYETFLNKEYFCYMTGFIAGMPFLGDLDNNLRTNRLETPRVKVPRGSIGLTEQFANIYTFESPGGWNIIGNTPIKIFDSSKSKSPNLISPGDIVIFKKISLNDYKNYNE
ncbi:allophanate hydrolase subunit 1 [Candidatus Pelagibacter sp.]|jgi:KipI family sensor histidine kinase inhibitor|nr:allophanate hydrolase subunit 1 [Candidatus Pelagibacter sp.]